MYLAACAAPICLMLPFRIIAPRTASAVERLRDKDNPCYNVSMDSKEKDKLSERQKRAMQKAEDISRVEGIQIDEVEKQFIADYVQGKLSYDEFLNALAKHVNEKYSKEGKKKSIP